MFFKFSALTLAALLLTSTLEGAITYHSCAAQLPPRPTIKNLDELENGTTVPMPFRGDLYSPRKMQIDWWSGNWVIPPQAQTNVPYPYNQNGFTTATAHYYTFDPTLWKTTPTKFSDIYVVTKNFYDEFHAWSKSRPEYMKPSYETGTIWEPEILLEGTPGETVYGSFAIIAAANLSDVTFDFFKTWPVQYPSSGLPLEVIHSTGTYNSKCVNTYVNAYSYQRPWNGSRLVASNYAAGQYSTTSQIRNRWALPTEFVPATFLSSIPSGQFRDIAFSIRIPKTPNIKGKNFFGRIVIRHRNGYRNIGVTLRVRPFDIVDTQPAVKKKGVGLFWEVPSFALSLDYLPPAQLQTATASPAQDPYRATRRMMTELHALKDLRHENLLISHQYQSNLPLISLNKTKAEVDITGVKRLMPYLADAKLSGNMIITANAIWQSIFNDDKTKLGPIDGFLSLRGSSGKEDSTFIRPEWNTATNGNTFEKLLDFFSDDPTVGYRAYCKPAPCEFRLALQLTDELTGRDTFEYSGDANIAAKDMATKRYQDFAYHVRAYEKKHPTRRIYLYQNLRHGPYPFPPYNVTTGNYRHSWYNYLKMVDHDKLFFPAEDGNTNIRSRKYIDIVADGETNRWKRFDSKIENGGYQPTQYPNWTTGEPISFLGLTSPVFDAYFRFVAGLASYNTGHVHFSDAFDNYQTILTQTALWGRLFGGLPLWASEVQVQMLLGFGTRVYHHGSTFNSMDNDCDTNYNPVELSAPPACDHVKDGSDGHMGALGYGTCVNCDAGVSFIPTREFLGRARGAEDGLYMERLQVYTASCDPTNAICANAKTFYNGMYKFLRVEKPTEDFSAPGVLPIDCGLTNVKNAIPRPVDFTKYDTANMSSSYLETAAGRLMLPGKNDNVLKNPAGAVLKDRYLQDSNKVDCIIRNASYHLALLANTSAPTISFQPVWKNPSNGAVGQIGILFSKPVKGVELGDFVLTANGVGNLLNSTTHKLTTKDNQVFYIADLTAATTPHYAYTLTLKVTAGITDLAGRPLSLPVTPQISWSNRDVL